LPAREALEGFLKSEQGDQSRLAPWALSEIAPVPEIVWTTLDAGLSSKEPDLALSTVRSMGVRARRLMPMVLGWLVDEENRWWALKALRTMGMLSPEARQAWQALMEDEVEDVRKRGAPSA